MNKKVAVIVLNYNTAELLDKMLPSVVSSSYQPLRIVVADNGSSDTSESIVAKFETVEWLPLGNNYGYAEGYNRAIRAVDEPFVVLLNSDVEVTTGWLEPLVEYAEKNNYDALQPKILDYKNRSLFEYAGAAGGFMDVLGYPFCRGRIFDHCEEDQGQYNQPIDIFWASGAALFIRKEAFMDAGGLDSRLFAHMEEIDLCWRLQLMERKIGCVPNSIVYHVGGGTLSAQSAKKTYLNFRNSLVLLARYNYGFKAFFKVFLRMILDAPAALLFLGKGKFKDVLAIIRAHWNFILKMNYWLRDQPELNLKKAIDTQFRRPIFWEYFVRGKRKWDQLLHK